MYCHFCGRHLKDGSRRCPYCEKELVEPVDDEPEVPSDPVANKTGLPRRIAGRKTEIVFLGIIAVLLVICLAVVLGVKIRRAHNSDEPTTEPTTVPVVSTEAPTQTAPPAPTEPDHFAKSRSQFYETASALAALLSSPADDFDLTSDESEYSYNGYAYINADYPDFHFLFTGRKSSEASRLKAVFGKVEDILPGRANYTYNELFEIFGDNMICDPDDDDPPYYGYTFTLKEETYRVEFTGPYMSSRDAGLDEFYLYAAKSYDYDEDDPPESETTSITDEQVREDPMGYFADQEQTDYIVSTDGDSLNVRTFCGTDYEIIDSVSDGTTVSVYGFYNGWAYARLPDGSRGWMSGNYLEKDE